MNTPSIQSKQFQVDSISSFEVFLRNSILTWLSPSVHKLKEEFSPRLFNYQVRKHLLQNISSLFSVDIKSPTEFCRWVAMKGRQCAAVLLLDSFHKRLIRIGKVNTPTPSDMIYLSTLAPCIKAMAYSMATTYANPPLSIEEPCDVLRR